MVGKKATADVLKQEKEIQECDEDKYDQLEDALTEFEFDIVKAEVEKKEFTFDKKQKLYSGLVLFLLVCLQVSN